jgi:hypothetical protein
VTLCTVHGRRSRSCCRKRSTAHVPGLPAGSPLSRCSEWPSSTKVRRHAREVCAARYYGPVTGQFLSIDPLVTDTRAAYTYAIDDPVNDTDPTGLSTNGYCVSVQGLLIEEGVGVGVGGEAEVCLVETSTGQIGLTLTGGYGLAVAADHTGSVNIVNEKSNGGWFDFYSAGAAIPTGDVPVGPGASLGGYIGCSNGQLISGGVFGVGAGVAGASALAGQSYTVYHNFGGLTAWIAKGFFYLYEHTVGFALEPAASLLQKLTSFIAHHIPHSWIPSS